MHGVVTKTVALFTRAERVNILEPSYFGCPVSLVRAKVLVKVRFQNSRGKSDVSNRCFATSDLYGLLGVMSAHPYLPNVNDPSLPFSPNSTQLSHQLSPIEYAITTKSHETGERYFSVSRSIRHINIARIATPEQLETWKLSL